MGFTPPPMTLRAKLFFYTLKQIDITSYYFDESVHICVELMHAVQCRYTRIQIPTTSFPL